MFTDIVGYSALSQRDETHALELLEEHRRLARPFFSKYKGKEIKTIGDAFLVEFSSAVEAVKCALEIQKKLQKQSALLPADKKIQIRIGIHVGDIVHREGDIYGDGVNIASRINPIAEPGGICFTDQVNAQIRNKIGTPIVNLGKHELKNIETPLDIYKLVLPWQEGVPLPKPVARAKALPLRKKQWLYFLPAIVLLLAIIIWFVPPKSIFFGPSGPLREIKSIAVLPLRNLSGDPEQEYFAEGMTEALITELSKIRALRVISRTSAMRYKKTEKSLPEIARHLKVDAVVEGSAQLEGDEVRITAQLIEAGSDQHLWADSYDRDLRNILVLQSEVAQAIARQIKITVTAEDKMRLSGAHPVNSRAHEAYLKGRYFINKFREEAVRTGISHFEQAIEIDSKYAPAYAGLAESYDILNSAGWMSPAEGWPRVKEEATRALELDEALAEAHTLLADVRFLYDWDWEGAEREFKRALELNPGQAISHQYYGLYLSAMARHREALAEIRRAQELDPLSLSISQTVGVLLRFAREYDLSIKQLKETVELDPNFAWAHWSLGEAYLQNSMFEEAIASLQKGLILSGDSLIIKVDLARGYALAGKNDEARNILDDLLKQFKEKYVSPYNLATIYASLGSKDKAFNYLEMAFEERSNNLAYLKVDPKLDNLRGDLRFSDLLKKMGLER